MHASAEIGDLQIAISSEAYFRRVFVYYNNIVKASLMSIFIMYSVASLIIINRGFHIQLLAMDTAV